MKTHEKLRSLRNAFGFSQEWFAKSIGVKQPLLSKFESGQKEIPDTLRQTILQVFINHASPP